MSDKARAWCWSNSPFTGAKFIVHFAMADVANDMHGNRLWITDRALAEKARTTTKTVQRTRRELVEMGMLAEIGDAPAAGRARQYRFLMPGDGGQDVQGTVDISSPTVDISSPTVDISSPTVDISSPPPITNQREPNSPRRRKPETAFPSVFQVTDEMRQWAHDNDIDVDLMRETSQFTDHALTHDRRARDWVAAWRTWMRKADEYRRAREPGTEPVRQDWEP